MKITFVMAGGFNLSGGDRVIAIYAEHLHKRGHDVFVVAQPVHSPTLTQQVKSVIKGKGLIPKPAIQPSHFDHLEVPHVRLNSHRPVIDTDVPDADVVIATWWETAEWVNKLSPSKGAKAFFIQHYEAFEYVSKERVDAVWKLPLHKITISKWLIDLASNKFGDNTVSLVFNSVDTDQFQAPPRNKQAIPTIGMLYSSTPWKGCDISLKSFSLVAEKIPGVKLVAFGNYDIHPDLPLPPGATYIRSPAQDRIKDIYASCDVWLCGSRGEGFHLPPLEAMACRCPVVSTEVGGPMDIIENGVNGYLAPLEDSATLADRLIQVLSLPDSGWRKMSDNAYETAIRYTWEDATDLFEAALNKAIARHKQGDFNPKPISV